MSGVVPTPTLPPSVVKQLARDLVGPLLLGALLNICLYGAFMMQVLTYFRHAHGDHTWMKAMVIALVGVDTLNSAVSAYVAYDYSVNDFGQVDKILRVTPLFGVMVVTIAITGSIVQAFFGLRVKWLTGNRWLGWAIIIAAFFQTLLGIGTIIGGYIVQEFVKFQKFRAVVTTWLVLAPVTDLALATSLATFLRASRTGFASTDDVLTRLTRLTIQTGLITAVWAAVDLALFLALDNNWHFVFNMSLAKLYGNCLMSSLNARTEWSEKYSSHGNVQNWSAHSRPGQTGVKVTTTRGTHMDGFEMNSTVSAPHYRAPVNVSGGTVIDIRNEAMSREARGDDLSLRESVSYIGDRKAGSQDMGRQSSAPSQDDRKVNWQGLV